MSTTTIEIVWQCDSALVVNKPAGLSTQAPAPHVSLESILREQLAGRTSYVAFPHRLDRCVGGLILVALTKQAARLLGEQFEARRVTKIYTAIVTGSVQPTSARWLDWLRKVDDEARGEAVVDNDAAKAKGAKPAELDMRVVSEIARDGVPRCILELRPLTGRMHQLRIQTSVRGHPILGDQLYGSSETTAGLAADGIALQASGLEFNSPKNGRRVVVQCTPPTWLPSQE